MQRPKSRNDPDSLPPEKAKDTSLRRSIVGLRSADRTKRIKLRLRLTGQGYSVATIPLQPTRKLNGNIGYLRVPEMDRRLVESIVLSKAFIDMGSHANCICRKVAFMLAESIGN